MRVLSKTCRYRQCVFLFCFSNNRCLIDGNKRKGILRQTESWRHFKTMIIIISFYRALRVLSMGRRTYTANRSDAFISRSRSSIYENRFIYLILFFFRRVPPRSSRTPNDASIPTTTPSQNAVNPSRRPPANTPVSMISLDLRTATRRFAQKTKAVYSRPNRVRPTRLSSTKSRRSVTRLSSVFLANRLRLPEV